MLKGYYVGIAGLEAWAYDRFRSLGVATPNVIAVETQTNHFPGGYMIATRLPGKPLTSLLLFPRQQRALLRSAGSLIRKVHTGSVQGYGWPDGEYFRTTGEVRGTKPTWELAIEGLLKLHISYLRDHSVLDGTDARTLQEPFERHASILSGYTESRLLHGDFLPRHIFVNLTRNRITGIIDPAGMLLGDPAYDLAVFSTSIFDRLEDLLGGYGPDEAMKEDLEVKIPLYRLLREIANLSWAHGAGVNLTYGMKRVKAARAATH